MYPLLYKCNKRYHELISSSAKKNLNPETYLNDIFNNLPEKTKQDSNVEYDEYDDENECKKIYSIYDKLMEEGPLIFDEIENVYCLYYEIPYSINDELDFLGLISTNNDIILDYRIGKFNSGKKDQTFIKCFTLLYTGKTEKKYW